MNSSSEWRNQDVEGLASGRIPPVSGCFSRWGGFEREDSSSGWGNQDVEGRARGRIVPLTGGFGTLRGLFAGGFFQWVEDSAR